MRMPELKALAGEHGLRGYSQLRKAELIAFLEDNEPQAPRQQRPPHPNRPSLPPPWSGPPVGASSDVYLGSTEGTTNRSQITRVRSSSN